MKPPVPDFATPGSRIRTILEKLYRDRIVLVGTPIDDGVAQFTVDGPACLAVLEMVPDNASAKQGVEQSRQAKGGSDSRGSATCVGGGAAIQRPGRSQCSSMARATIGLAHSGVAARSAGPRIVCRSQCKTRVGFGGTPRARSTDVLLS